MDSADTGLLLLRLWLGLVMIAHGVNHARTLDGTTSWFESKGFRQPALNARASAFGEIAIGFGVALGLLTSVAAAGLIATMTVAFWSIHRFAGFFVFKRPDEGYEYVATLAVAALVLGTLGPGAASLDALLDLEDTLSGWTGLVIGFGGVLAGFIQLAVFWRRPTQEKT